MHFLSIWLLFSRRKSSICFFPPLPNIFIAGYLTALWVYINLPRNTFHFSSVSFTSVASFHWFQWTLLACLHKLSLLKFNVFFYYFFLFFLWPLLLIPYILLLSSTINLCYSKLILNCLPPTVLFDHLHTALFIRKKPPRSCLPTTGSLSIVVGLVWKVLINFLRGRSF